MQAIHSLKQLLHKDAWLEENFVNKRILTPEIYKSWLTASIFFPPFSSSIAGGELSLSSGPFSTGALSEKRSISGLVITRNFFSFACFA